MRVMNVSHGQNKVTARRPPNNLASRVESSRVEPWAENLILYPGPFKSIQQFLSYLSKMGATVPTAVHLHP